MKNTQIIVAVIVGIIIGAGGYAVMNSQADMGAMTHDEHAAMGHAMDHKGIQVDVDASIPTVSIMAYKDTMSGFNIHVSTKNYTFTADKAGAEPVQGEGHAHVYVNGTKVMRLYGEWAHLPKELFVDGENTISVTLNANDHSDWLIGETHVEASTVVTK